MHSDAQDKDNKQSDAQGGNNKQSNAQDTDNKQKVSNTQVIGHTTYTLTLADEQNTNPPVLFGARNVTKTESMCR